MTDTFGKIETMYNIGVLRKQGRWNRM